MSRMAGGGARAVVVVEAEVFDSEGFYIFEDFLFLGLRSTALGFNLGFAFTVGGLGLFEYAENMFALS